VKVDPSSKTVIRAGGATTKGEREGELVSESNLIICRNSYNFGGCGTSKIARGNVYWTAEEEHITLTRRGLVRSALPVIKQCERLKGTGSGKGLPSPEVGQKVSEYRSKQFSKGETGKKANRGATLKNRKNPWQAGEGGGVKKSLGTLHFPLEKAWTEGETITE